LSDLIPRPLQAPVDLTLRDFAADRAAGKASLYFDAANAAAKMICGIYGKSPSTVVNIIPAGGGLIDNSRGVFDDLCAPNQLPPAPSLPFSGGQCDGVGYNVFLNYTTQRGVQPPDCGLTAVVTNSNVGYAFGPISGIRLANGGNFVNSCGVYTYTNTVLTCKGTNLTGPQPLGEYIIAGSSRGDILTMSVASIQRGDGQPDICGNPALSYPPPSATPSDFTDVAIVHISPTATVSVPITFTPTVSPVIGNFRPEFNFNVGGINVNLSPAGFTFSPTLEIPVNLPAPYFDPRSSPGSPRLINPPSNGAGTSPLDLAAITARLKRIEQEIIDCCAAGHPYSPPPLANIIVTSLGSGAGGTLTLPALTFRVDVNITARPAKEKLQVGTLSPDVLFAGWARFSDGTTTGKRQAIDSVKTFFSPTERIANTFTYSLYTGYTANVIAFSVTPTPPAP